MDFDFDGTDGDLGDWLFLIFSPTWLFLLVVVAIVVYTIGRSAGWW